MTMLATIQNVRAKYPTPCGDDDCVAICNEVAWIYRAAGYGVSRKESGTRGTRYDGQQCCHDVIMFQDGTYWDILISAGEASIPKWGTNGDGQPSGYITDPTRGWIAPIPPQDQPPPPPPPDDLAARVTALEAEVRRIQRWIEGY